MEGAFLLDDKYLVAANLARDQLEIRQGYAVYGVHCNLRSNDVGRLVIAGVKETPEEANFLASVLGAKPVLQLGRSDDGDIATTHSFTIPPAAIEARLLDVIDPRTNWDFLNRRVSLPPRYCSLPTADRERCPVNEYVPRLDVGKIAIWEIGLQPIANGRK